MELVDEAVLDGKTHTMDSLLIYRFSFRKEIIFAFFLLQLPFIAPLSESAAMSIWNFLCSLEMMSFQVDHWLGPTRIETHTHTQGGDSHCQISHTYTHTYLSNSLEGCEGVKWSTDCSRIH